MASQSSPVTVLIPVDIQRGAGEYPLATKYGKTLSSDIKDVGRNVSSLLTYFREKGGPSHSIIHVKHNSVNPASPLHPDSEGNAFLDFAKPKDGEIVIEKNVNSGFIGTNLEQILRERGVTRLLVMGVTTDHCASTTVRMAANLNVCSGNGDGSDKIKDPKGYDGEIFLIEDATFTHGPRRGLDAETIHQAALAGLDGEFCRVVRTDEMLKILGE